MSSGESTEKILDLLYGDHTPEEQEELREALTRSPKDRAELASYEETLSAFREALPVEEMPTSAHGAIMAAARKQAAENLSNSTYAVRPARAANSGSPGTSVWSRLSIGPIAQIAAVAVLLLVGAVFMRQFSEPPADTFAEANNSVAQEVRFDNFGTPQQAAPTPAPQGEALALADAPMEEAESAEEEIAQQQGPREQASEGALDSLDGKEIAAVERSYEPAPAPRRRAAAPRPTPAPRPTARSAPSADYSIPRLSSPAPAKKSSPQAESFFDLDDFGAGRAASEEPAKASAPSAPASAAATNTGAATAPATSARAGAAGAAAPEAESKADRSEAIADSVAEPSPLALAEAAYRSANYGEAIRQADALLARSGSSPTERARALDIKGQSLLAMGREAEADRVFATLESQHPDYRSTSISKTREGIAQRRPAPRRAADLEAEESEAAMEAPEQASPPSKFEVPEPQPTSY